MPTVYLKPNAAIVDTDANVSTGAYTDVDEGVNGGTPDGNLVTSIPDILLVSRQYDFPIENAPGDYDSLTGVILRARGQITGTYTDDTYVYTVSVVGTNAPTNTVAWTASSEAGNALANKATASETPSPTAANIDGWVIRVTQTGTKNMGNDGLAFALDGLEIELDYATAGKSGSGDLNIAQPTASGSVKIIKNATAAATMAAVAASGAAILGPKVWLNTTETKSGATEMTVTAFNAAGTSITFSDPGGAPIGSLKLGVENRNDDNLGWIAVTVNASRTASGTPNVTAPTSSGTASAGANTKTASGDLDITAPTSSGQADIILPVTGAANVTSPTASGVARFAHDSSGTPLVTAITAVGQAGRLQDASGAITLDEIAASGTGTAGSTFTASGNITHEVVTASGVARFAHDASGAITHEVVTASGTGTSSSIFSASGNITHEVVTASGTTVQTYKPSGAITHEVVTASGTTVQTYKPSGAITHEVVTASGVARFAHDASGAITHEAATASGVISLQGLTTASGNITHEAVTASGVARFAHDVTGAANVPVITASGVLANSTIPPRVWLNTTQTINGATEMTVTAWSDTSVTFDDPIGAPSGSLYLGVENRTWGDGEGGDVNTGWIAVTVTSATVVNGTATIAAPTATGSAIVTSAEVLAYGNPLTTSPTASGTAILGPQVYLNSTQTLVGATRMAVTAFNSDSSITFDDPVGAPVGALYLAVENRNTTEVGYIATTVNVAVTLGTTGAITINPVTSQGLVNNFKGTASSPTLEVIYPTAVAWLPPTSLVSGTSVLAPVTASGVARFAHDASGSPSITTITAAGGAGFNFSASGTSQLEAVTASGAASQAIYTASGAITLQPVTASSVAKFAPEATGTVVLGAITASGVAGLAQDASGAITIDPATSSGVALAGRLAGGATTLAPITATATVANNFRRAIGNATVPAPIPNGYLLRIRPALDADGAVTTPTVIVSRNYVRLNPLATPLTAAEISVVPYENRTVKVSCSRSTTTVQHECRRTAAPFELKVAYKTPCEFTGSMTTARGAQDYNISATASIAPVTASGSILRLRAASGAVGTATLQPAVANSLVELQNKKYASGNATHAVVTASSSAVVGYQRTASGTITSLSPTASGIASWEKYPAQPQNDGTYLAQKSTTSTVLTYGNWQDAVTSDIANVTIDRTEMGSPQAGDLLVSFWFAYGGPAQSTPAPTLHTPTAQQWKNTWGLRSAEFYDTNREGVEMWVRTATGDDEDTVICYGAGSYPGAFFVQRFTFINGGLAWPDTSTLLAANNAVDDYDLPDMLSPSLIIGGRGSNTISLFGSVKRATSSDVGTLPQSLDQGIYTLWKGVSPVDASDRALLFAAGYRISHDFASSYAFTQDDWTKITAYDNDSCGASARYKIKVP